VDLQFHYTAHVHMCVGFFYTPTETKRDTMLDLQFKRLDDAATLPTKSNPKDMGWDIYVVADVSFRSLPVSGCGPNCTSYIKTKTLMPGQSHKFKTGIACAIPDGYGMMFWDRSGLGSKGVHRLAGVIDCTYRGEWQICLTNLGGSAIKITEGDRIVQGVLQQMVEAEARWVDELDETERGEGGFGSTGA